MVDLNATQAAIRAGYSADSAGSIGNEILQIPEVRAHIDGLLAEQSKRTGYNADRVLREIAKVAFVNPVDVVNFDSAALKANVPREDTAAISSVKVKSIPTPDGEGIEREIRFCDKLKALELLGKRFGLFTDRIEVTDVPVIKDDI